MLVESDVVDAVCGFLKSQGYEIRQKRSPSQRGHDIIAVKRGTPDRVLYIEAKGGTSSKPSTKRYGKPFDGAQIRVHVAEALYKAATVVSTTGPSVDLRAGLALPATDRHRELMKRIGPVLRQLEIAVFWVSENREVQLASSWAL
ncbi:MAG TPA: hypothetical protein VMW58_00765 [Anaerolineae bacterium]|nr:hypothetical protein [Anaerolineae bacterium]